MTVHVFDQLELLLPTVTVMPPLEFCFNDIRVAPNCMNGPSEMFSFGPSLDDDAGVLVGWSSDLPPNLLLIKVLAK